MRAGPLGAAILLLLTLAARIEGSFRRRQSFAAAVIRFESNGGKTAFRIEEILDDFHIPPSDQTWTCPLDEAFSEVSIRYHHLHRHHRECLTRLSEMPAVLRIEREDAKLLDRWK